ncbi:MAG: hypothetical protein WAN79_14650, partial [Opitutaceae bacterium]
VVAKAPSGTVSDIVKEGLTIAGWVAMWRPLEIYLYDWWPLFEERRRLERLARMQVRIEMPAADTGGSGAIEFESEESHKAAA